MLTDAVNGKYRPSYWLRVREFAVPPAMIETATARRLLGDWAGACAAAGVDLDFNPRALARTYGTDLAARIRADLRALAPDLLRWHLPRIAPDGLLRPGLTVALARYDTERARPVHLVARTAPAWADAGQRISLALQGGSRRERYAHPHPRPSRRFRLDLHRHLWDAERAGELRARSGADLQPAADQQDLISDQLDGGCAAVDRWAAEAAILLRADGLPPGSPVAVRLGARRRFVLDPEAGPPGWRAVPPSTPLAELPVLPDAATWVPPDLELLRAGLIEADRLHPLVAAALVPGHLPAGAGRASDEARPDGTRLVDCRGARHRIGLVDGVLVALDHDPEELRREELLVALTGTPLPCLQEIDRAHRHPDDLTGVRERLDHGDTAGAFGIVERLLGPEAVLREGLLKDELRAAAQARVTHGLYRAGLIGAALPDPGRRRRRDALLHPVAY